MVNTISSIVLVLDDATQLSHCKGSIETSISQFIAIATTLKRSLTALISMKVSFDIEQGKLRKFR